MKIYLAGPDVFRKDHQAHGAFLKDLCKKHGAVGLWPMDNEIGDGLGDEPDRIRQANMAMIRECDAVVANMLPFRGPSMDVGTAYEMGVGAALGKIVVGYTRAAGSYLQRVRAFYAKALVDGCPLERDGASWRDQQGDAVEAFVDPATDLPLHLVDNLMIARGVHAMTVTVEEAIRAALEIGKATGVHNRRSGPV